MYFTFSPREYEKKLCSAKFKCIGTFCAIGLISDCFDLFILQLKSRGLVT